MRIYVIIITSPGQAALMKSHVNANQNKYLMLGSALVPGEGLLFNLNILGMPNSTQNKTQDLEFRVKICDELLDHLCYLCDSPDSRADLYGYRSLTIELLSILTDPRVSSKMGEMSQLHIGPFLNRLHEFITCLIESDEVIRSIDSFYAEHYMKN
jgi:hypothetical protein